MQNNAPKFEEIQSFWSDVTMANVQRFANMVDQWAKLEKKAVVQASNGVDEMAKLWKASIDYMTDINDQFRDLTVEQMKRGSDKSE